MPQQPRTWDKQVRAFALAAVVASVMSGAPAIHAADKPGTKEAKGQVQSVDGQAGRIVLKVRGKEMTFEVPPALRGELANVSAGDRIEIDYEEKDGKFIATTIESD